MSEVKGKSSLFQDWIQGEGLKTVCDWARHGLSDAQIMENMGIGRASFYGWLAKYPEFAQEIKQARLKPNIEIENAMFDLACGRTFVEEVKTTIDVKTSEVSKIEKTRKQIPPSPVLLIFLAKNRMKDRYKDYAPSQPDTESNTEQPNIQIYLPENGRELNDSETATRTAGKIPVH